MQDRFDKRYKELGVFADTKGTMSKLGDSVDDFYKTQKDLNQKILQRAAELEGRVIPSLTGVEDKTFDQSIIGKEADGTPIPKNQSKVEGSTSIWDIQESVVDENNKPILNSAGKAVWKEKYNFIDATLNSNWGALSDPYYIASQLAEGAGSSTAFVATGFTTGAALSGAGKVASATGRALKTDRLLPKAVEKFAGSSLSGVEKTELLAKIAQKSAKISNATKTATLSYINTNTESDQIGRQVEKRCSSFFSR